MTIATPIWSISALNCKSDVDGLVDYVVTAHWDCTATDGQYRGRVYNTTSFEVDADKPDYIPYADLTEEQVVAWVQASLGAETVAATEANVLQQIEYQINPPIVTPTLPWVD
jgi:hypothetical protein